MPHRLLLPDLISYSATALACDAGVQWTQALRLLHHMRTFSRGLDYHRRQDANSSAAPRVMLVMQPCASHCYTQEEAVPHAVFRCLGLVMVHKPPGWEVGTQDIGIASGLCIWL